MRAKPRRAAVISFILCLPAAIILLFDVMGVDTSFWQLPVSHEIVVFGALLLVPVGLAIISTPIRLSPIIGFFIVLPFIILELVNRRHFNEGFPIPLFIILWFLSTIFVAILMPIVRSVRAGNYILANPVFLVLRVAFLVIIGWAWGTWVIDQLPCFMGVPNCD